MPAVAEESVCLAKSIRLRVRAGGTPRMPAVTPAVANALVILCAATVEPLPRLSPQSAPDSMAKSLCRRRMVIPASFLPLPWERALAIRPEAKPALLDPRHPIESVHGIRGGVGFSISIQPPLPAHLFLCGSSVLAYTEGGSLDTQCLLH